MEFCTAINCMDGRVQLPVIQYLMDRVGVRHVDSVTEPGPVRILAERDEPALVASILARVRVSVERHGSRHVAVVAHHDCTGNPLPREQQLGQLAAAVAFLREAVPTAEVFGLWVTPELTVQPVE